MFLFVKTKNITLKIDEHTYQRARIRAAEEGTSVSAMVREFLSSGGSQTGSLESRRISSLKAMYRKADRRARTKSSKIKPLSRDEIYAEGLR